VLDLGCGPGRITGYLHELGLDVSGADLSPAMVAEAIRRFPTLRFTVGRLDAPGVAKESLAGLLAWYSLIHVSPPHLTSTMHTIADALRPGGYLQLAFQVGAGAERSPQAFVLARKPPRR
jgi:trans-aconitate methyltransferase